MQSELYISKSRVSVHYTIKDEKNETDLELLKCQDNLPFELMKDGKSYNTGIREIGNHDGATVTFVEIEPIDFPVILDIDIDQIGDVKGQWKAQIELKDYK
ncbi:MAG: hypothetical protein ACRCSG_03010 [Cellulosilyticaceae bacterium]